MVDLVNAVRSQGLYYAPPDLLLGARNDDVNNDTQRHEMSKIRIRSSQELIDAYSRSSLPQSSVGLLRRRELALCHRSGHAQLRQAGISDMVARGHLRLRGETLTDGRVGSPSLRSRIGSGQ